MQKIDIMERGVGQLVGVCVIAHWQRDMPSGLRRDSFSFLETKAAGVVGQLEHFARSICPPRAVKFKRLGRGRYSVTVSFAHRADEVVEVDSVFALLRYVLNRGVGKGWIKFYAAANGAWLSSAMQQAIDEWAAEYQLAGLCRDWCWERGADGVGMLSDVGVLFTATVMTEYGVEPAERAVVEVMRSGYVRASMDGGSSYEGVRPAGSVGAEWPGFSL